MWVCVNPDRRNPGIHIPVDVYKVRMIYILSGGKKSGLTVLFLQTYISSGEKKKRIWTVGTRLSTPQDGAINARPTLVGRQRRLTGHKYLRNRLSHRDVSSCRFFLWREGLSPLHATGVMNASGSGRCGWEGFRVHIGPHWAERVGQAPPGVVWVGVLVSFPVILPFRQGSGPTLIRCLENNKCEIEWTQYRDLKSHWIRASAFLNQDIRLVCEVIKAIVMIMS